MVGYNPATMEGALARPIARLAALVGRPDEADELFREALDAHQRWPAPYWIARTQLDWAEALLARDPADTEARALIRDATASARGRHCVRPGTPLRPPGDAATTASPDGRHSSALIEQPSKLASATSRKGHNGPLAP
jgi:hypothetical protein